MSPSSRILVLVALLLSSPFAFAGEVEDAEHVRLTEEMRRLSKRNAWKGVEAAFVELEQLRDKRDVALTYEDYWLGAQSARAMGDINGVYSRLKLAAKAEGTREVIEWLSDLDANYGQVDIESKKKEAVALAPAAMPFAPDQRAAIEAAQAMVAADGEYEGLLPKGQYSFGTETLTVVAGGDVVQLVLEDTRPAKGEREPFELAYIGPRATIGPAFTSAGEPSTVSWEADAFQPHGFSGAGARLGVGLEAGLGEKLGVLAEVGYHGGFGAGVSEDEVASSAGTPYELTARKLNTGYGWLAGELRLGKLWLNAGPIWSVGSASTSDIPTADEGAPCVNCVVAARGTIMAAGGAGGASFALTDIGNLSGALSLLGGAQSDGSRLYTWGQLGFTLAPASPKGE
jgi:hypothetical protein